EISRSIFAAVRDVAQDSRNYEPLAAISTDPAQLRDRGLMTQERDQLDAQVVDACRPIDTKLVGGRLHRVFDAAHEAGNIAGGRTRLLLLQFLLGSDRLSIGQVATRDAAGDKQCDDHPRQPGRVFPEQHVPHCARHCPRPQAFRETCNYDAPKSGPPPSRTPWPAAPSWPILDARPPPSKLPGWAGLDRLHFESDDLAIGDPR